MYDQRKNKMNGKSNFLALVLSVMPGLGHMYIGHMNKGLIIMSLFLFLSFFIGWLRLPLLGFVLPVIWFYSVFDVQNLKNEPEIKDIEISKIIPIINNKINYKYVGLGLILVGVLIIIQEFVHPIIIKYIGYEFTNMIQTLIVSIIFIYGGVKLIYFNRENKSIKKEEKIDGE